MTKKSAIEVTEIEKGLEKILDPFQDFIQDQTTGSIWLLLCTIVALALVNSSFGPEYLDLFHTKFGLVLGDLSFSMSVRHWINDGLMALFFFLLGMEIKREILAGEIRELDKLVPIGFAAVGGMVVPAALYLSFNYGTPYQAGWGITMATDAAFAIGILALLGKNIPTAAFTFLTALAILDDIGAILVITLFYSDSIDTVFVGISLLVLLILVICNIVGIRRPSVYLLIGTLLWAAMLKSGIHATVAGILVAATVPARAKREPGWFLNYASNLISKFKRLEKQKKANASILDQPEQHEVVEKIKEASEEATTPLRRWEETFEHPVTLFILPAFALANAGIIVEGVDFGSAITDPLMLGIVLGLVLGKSVGISFFTWLALKLGYGSLPKGLTLKHVVGLGLLGGIGFTMSIFITNLGFESMDDVLNRAKFSILIGSFISGAAAYAWFQTIKRTDKKTEE